MANNEALQKLTSSDGFEVRDAAEEVAKAVLAGKIDADLAIQAIAKARDWDYKSYCRRSHHSENDFDKYSSKCYYLAKALWMIGKPDGLKIAESILHEYISSKYVQDPNYDEFTNPGSASRLLRYIEEGKEYCENYWSVYEDKKTSRSTLNLISGSGGLKAKLAAGVYFIVAVIVYAFSGNLASALLWPITLVAFIVILIALVGFLSA